MVQFSYKNKTASMVVFKCVGSKSFFLEKVIFPQEIFTVLLPEGSRVEVWGIESYGPQLEERFRVFSHPSHQKIAA